MQSTNPAFLAPSWSFPTGARPFPLIIAHRGDGSSAPENTLPAFAAAHRARTAWGEAAPRLALLDAPALVLAGADDPLLAAARLLAETLPRGRLETLPGCGAGAPFTAPRAFEAALGAFLGDMRAGADGW